MDWDPQKRGLVSCSFLNTKFGFVLLRDYLLGTQKKTIISCRWRTVSDEVYSRLNFCQSVHIFFQVILMSGRQRQYKPTKMYRNSSFNLP